MFYRRKILLSLIELFGGKLEKTRFEKLIFLFCSRNEKHFYDFFPYKYGAFSFVTYQDKRVLTKQGYLKDSEAFILENKITFIDKIKSDDKADLMQFHSEMKGKSRKSLLRKTYLQYPYFASKSEIIKEVLNEPEIQEIEIPARVEDELMLFTIGYEGLSIDAYLNKLIKNDIRVIIDIRKNPRSMKFNFSGVNLQRYLSHINIEYIHFPELGTPKKARELLLQDNDYQKFFKSYRANVLEPNTGSLTKIVNLIIQKKRVALNCFEKDYLKCHRNTTSEFIRKQHPNTIIVHI